MAEAIKMGGGISIPSKEKFYINKNIDASIKTGDFIQFTGDYIEKKAPVYSANDGIPPLGLYKLSDHRYFYLHTVGDYGYVYGAVLTTNSDNTDFDWGSSYLPNTRIPIIKTSNPCFASVVLSSNLIINISTEYTTKLVITIIRISDTNAITAKAIDVTTTLTDVSFNNMICIPVKINSNSFYLIYANKNTPTLLCVRKIIVNENDTLTYDNTIKNLSTNQNLINQFTIYDVVDDVVSLVTQNIAGGETHTGIVRLDLDDINNSTLSNTIKINTIESSFSYSIVYDILISPTKNTLYVRAIEPITINSSTTHIYLVKVDISNKNSISMLTRKIFNVNEDCGRLIKVFDDNNVLAVMGNIPGQNSAFRYFSYIFTSKDNRFHMSLRTVKITNSYANTGADYKNLFCEMPANPTRGVVFLSLFYIVDSGNYSTFADISESYTVKKFEDYLDGIALTPGTSGKQIKVLV